MNVDGRKSTESVSGPTIELRGVTRRFGATVAIDDLSITIAEGSVHALLGENGAGKSTTMKVLSGLVVPDGGQVVVAGSPCRFRSARDAQKAGIQTAFQELTLVPDLTVLENMLLPTAPWTLVGTLAVRRVSHKVAEHFEQLDLHVPLHERAGELDLALRQKIEIARALFRRPTTLLLDEPTSSLSGRDVEWLGRIVADCRERGMTTVFITHRLPEVRAFCDHVTVLRNGRHVLTGNVADISDEVVVESIIGSSLDRTFPPRTASLDVRQGRIVLELRRVSCGTNLREVDLDLREGEIHGVAGLQGMGQKALFDVCFGQIPVLDGDLLVDDEPVHLRSPADALHPSIGIGLVPEERKSEGLFLKLDGTRNASLPVIGRMTRFGLIDRARELERTRRAFASVDLVPEATFLPAMSFSGGNQQKIAVAKWLVAESRILLLFDPTRGIDVGTKHQLYGLMRAYVEAGGAILFFSTEIPELVHTSDRITVLYEGEVTARFDGRDATEVDLMRAVLGDGTERRAERPA